MPKRELIITADDYGLSRGNTDTILETVAGGTVTNISILANGDAIEYAVAEYAKHAGKATVSVHINLTEGRLVSDDPSVRILADDKGMFRYSVGGLWAAYFFAGNQRKFDLSKAVRAEAAAQIGKIRALLSPHRLAIAGVDGHQHVHMVPFIFDALIVEKPPYIRMTHEPWYFVPYDFGALIGIHALSRFALAALSLRNRRAAAKAGVPTSAFFLGFVFSGRMALNSFTEGMYAVALRHRTGVTEACFHPGSALPHELDQWTNAQTAWHYDKNRTHERKLLTDNTFKALCDSFRAGQLNEKRWYRALPTIARFVISGGTAAFTQLAILFLLTEYAHIWYIVSNILAFFCSFIVSFLLQKYWTFEDGSGSGLHGQAARYLALQITSLALNSALLTVLVEGFGLWYLAAEFFIMIGLAFGTFFISRKVIFNRS